MGGSVTKAQVVKHFSYPGLARFPFEWVPRRLRCPHGAPDQPGGLPQAGIHQVAIAVHRHCGGGVPQHPLHHLRVRARGQPQRCRGVAQIMNAPRAVMTDRDRQPVASPARNTLHRYAAEHSGRAGYSYLSSSTCANPGRVPACPVQPDGPAVLLTRRNPGGMRTFSMARLAAVGASHR